MVQFGDKRITFKSAKIHTSKLEHLWVKLTFFFLTETSIQIFVVEISKTNFCLAIGFRTFF